MLKIGCGSFCLVVLSPNDMIPAILFPTYMYIYHFQEPIHKGTMVACILFWPFWTKMPLLWMLGVLRGGILRRVNLVFLPCFAGYRIALIRLLMFSVWALWLWQCGSVCVCVCVFCPNVQGHFLKNTMWSVKIHVCVHFSLSPPQIGHQLIKKEKRGKTGIEFFIFIFGLVDCLNIPFLPHVNL